MIKIDILTYASGYKYYIFERFVKTLKNTGFKGNINIITKKNDIPNIIKIKSKYSNINHFLDNLVPFTNPNNHRYFTYLHFLKKKINCDYILICDFRDVLFQKNIENLKLDSNIDLFGFLENKKIIEEKKYNTPWIKIVEKILNINFFDKISNEYIICSGTTIGTLKGIRLYINYMCKILLKIGIYKNIILDQGIHNYLLHLKILPIDTKLLSNYDNIVNTVGLDNKNMNNDNLITNNDNKISYIVHQYDRFPVQLKKKLNVKYNLNFL